MQSKQDLAIILRTLPFEDRHRIVTALTEKHGRVSALARNSIQSRRFGGTLDLFAASQWTFSEKEGADLFQLIEAQIKRGFEGLRKDFDRMALASLLNELMLKVAPERQSCEELFKLHSNALAVLEDLPINQPHAELIILNAYLAKILQWSGHQPQLQMCLGCSCSIASVASEEGVKCHVAQAGWYCPNCTVPSGGDFKNLFHRISIPAVADFYASLVTPIRQISEKCQAPQSDHRELFKFLESLIIYHVPGLDRTPLKSSAFLKI